MHEKRACKHENRAYKHEKHSHEHEKRACEHEKHAYEHEKRACEHENRAYMSAFFTCFRLFTGPFRLYHGWKKIILSSLYSNPGCQGIRLSHVPWPLRKNI
jgi:hypothetical protein